MRRPIQHGPIFGAIRREVGKLGGIRKNTMGTAKNGLMGSGRFGGMLYRFFLMLSGAVNFHGRLLTSVAFAGGRGGKA